MDTADRDRYRETMSDMTSAQSYGVVYATPPVGQSMLPPGAPGYVGPLPNTPRGPKNLLSVIGAVAGVLGLIIGSTALVFTVTRPSPVSPPPVQPAAKPFMVSADADKQWCSSLRPLLQENLDMTPPGIIDAGPSGEEYVKYSAWVRGWADRMNSALNKTAEANGSGWLDRTGRRLTDLTLAVSFVNHDQWFKTDAGPVFNDAASVSTSIASYCRSVGEPVRQ